MRGRGADADGHGGTAHTLRFLVYACAVGEGTTRLVVKPPPQLVPRRPWRKCSTRAVPDGRVAIPPGDPGHAGGEFGPLRLAGDCADGAAA